MLLYADDIVLIAPTEENLQLMLDTMNSWCRKWKLTVNQEKTKVIHFRTSSVNRSTFEFKCGDKDIEYTSSYKYLRLWLHEHLNLNKSVSELSKSASRALSTLYTKSLKAGGMTIDVFEKLYESLVEPVLFYASGIWGIIEKYKLSKIKPVDISLVEENARQMWPYKVIWAGIRVILNKKLKYSECGSN